MEWFLNEIKEVAKNNFTKWYGFLASSALLVGFLLAFYALIPDGRLRFLWYAYGVLTIELLFFAYWLQFSFLIRKCRKDRTGLTLVIHADSNDAERDLKNDFINTIIKSLADTNIHDVFDVIVIKNHLASKYNTINKIESLHKKVKGHIYIFGETKKRKNGDDEYFLSLNGYVAHRPIAKEVSDQLAKEFVSTLPKTINFKEEFAFQGFTITASVVLKCVKYIVGIASFVSGNPLLAIRLHEDLKLELQNTVQKISTDIAILNKLDIQLAEEYSIFAQYYFARSNMNDARIYLDKALSLKKNLYSALILESNFAFIHESDPIKSLRVLKLCHSVDHNSTWRFNETFLYFWQENYSSALKQCEKLKNSNLESDRSIAEEVVGFNEKQLKNTTDKPQLHFWLAFNYYFKLSNLPMALEHCDKFLTNTANDVVKYEKLRNKANGWLADISKQLEII